MTTITSHYRAGTELAAMALATVIAFLCRIVRIVRAVLAVTRKHVHPALGAVLTVCLIVPGPVDEIVVFLVIAGYAAFKPDMRADIAAAVRNA